MGADAAWAAEPESLQALLDRGDIVEDPPDCTDDLAKMLDIVQRLPSAAASPDRTAVSGLQAQGLTTLVSLLTAARQRELSAQASLDASQARVSQSGRAAALDLAGAREVLARYRTMEQANAISAAGSAGPDIELEPEGALTSTELARAQAAADPAHTTHVLRLLREKRQRRALQHHLKDAEAALGAAQVGDHTNYCLRSLHTTSSSLRELAVHRCGTFSCNRLMRTCRQHYK